MEKMKYSEIMNLIERTIIHQVQGNNSSDVNEILSSFSHAYIAIPEPIDAINDFENHKQTRSNSKRRSLADSVEYYVDLEEIMGSNREIVYVHHSMGKTIRVLKPSQGHIWMDANKIETDVYQFILFLFQKQFNKHHRCFGVIDEHDDFSIVMDDITITYLLGAPKERKNFNWSELNHWQHDQILQELGFGDDYVKKKDYKKEIHDIMFHRGLILYS
jgi:hypothetical protein